MTAAPLTKLTASLFELSPFAQRAENICSMVNFFPLAERLMNRLENISKIVEIGAENGYNTRALLNYAAKRHILLDTVDPFLPENAKLLLQSPQFRFHQTVSGEYLSGNDRYHVIFMDGDHNYETVLMDLETIDRKRKQNCIKVIFLHDVCWPWAYRDIYYGPERIKAPHPYDYNIRVSPYEEERSEQGLSSGNYATALAEGGENNGVLCAVENFLKTTGSRWRFKSFPVLYGIGVLYDVENFSQKELNAFEAELHQQLSSRELMSVLELNRVENLCKIEALRLDIVRAGEVWKQDQSYITTLELEKDRWQSKCNKLEKNRLELEGELWNSRQKIRRLLIRTPDIFWRWHGGKWNCLLPYGVRNRCRLHKIAELLHTSEIRVFSIDVFDTLLLRECKSEIARFREIAKLVHQAFPEISSRNFFQARVLAHHLAYQLTKPVQGCREVAFGSIYRLIGAILQEYDAIRLATMQEIELSYETSHLRLNPNIRKLLEIAHMRNIRIIAVSDMYLNCDALAQIINNFLPPGMLNEIYSSADFGISKVSGLLWDEVLRREQVSPQEILHLGDNPVADFEMPYIRCGITSVLLLRSALYNRYIRWRNRRNINQLQKERIYNGVR